MIRSIKIFVHPHGQKVVHSTCVKSTCFLTLGVKSMLITKSLIKLNNIFVRIPRDTGRIKDLSENRWGYRFISKNL